MFSRLESIAKKNVPEMVAFITNSMPSFVYGRRVFRDIPVFCFHSAHHGGFEQQLYFLQRNQYRTLTADELSERLRDPSYRNDGKEIALTFDDGLASVWTVAFPMLQKYEFRIISFILPGLISEGEQPGPRIDNCEPEVLTSIAERDFGDSPLCNWKEIQYMHDSGLVDFQSHGMHHALISTTPRITDFIYPEFDAHHYGNIHIPVYSDGSRDNLRKKVLGHPVYIHDTRFSGKRRYLDPPQIRQACADYVDANGGEMFFRNKGWKKKISAFAEEQKRIIPEEGRFESEQERSDAIRKELLDSKVKIETRLRKQVRHFCFPWFRASETSVSLAGECGYESIHLGATEGFRRHRSKHYPTCVTRLQEEYLLALPGLGNRTLSSIWMGKLQGYASR